VFTYHPPQRSRKPKVNFFSITIILQYELPLIYRIYNNINSDRWQVLIVYSFHDKITTTKKKCRQIVRTWSLDRGQCI